MAKESTVSKDQLKKAAELGKVDPTEPQPPPGVNLRDPGVPPDLKEAEAASAAEGELRGKLARADEGAELAQEEAEAIESLSVEAWAERAGYLPQFWKSDAAARNGRLRAVAPRTNPRYWIFAGAKAYHQWAVGQPMTLAEFNRQVALAHSHPIR